MEKGQQGTPWEQEPPPTQYRTGVTETMRPRFPMGMGPSEGTERYIQLGDNLHYITNLAVLINNVASHAACLHQQSNHSGMVSWDHNRNANQTDTTPGRTRQ